MTTEGRDNAGRFAQGNAGGPGRPSGQENRTTIDLREIRRRVVASWERVGGDDLLDRIARENPREYLKLVLALLPRETPSQEGRAQERAVNIVMVRENPPPEVANRYRHMAE